MIVEAERIRLAYDKRKQNNLSAQYSLLNPANLITYQQREKVLLMQLNRAFRTDVADKRVLDIGCGAGGSLLPMMLYGFQPENCFGVDLLEDRIEYAKRKFPSMSFECCSAEQSTFQKGSFDLVMMFTCLSSILEVESRKIVSQSATDMIKPNGYIIIYDFVYNNPRNPDVKAVTLRQLKSLFKRCTLKTSHKLTLAPPLARFVGKYSYYLCRSLFLFPFLCTHRMTMFQKGNDN